MNAVDQIKDIDDLFAVQCQICGITKRQLSRHLRVVHSMEPVDYLAQFPGSLIDVPESRSRSKECRTKQSTAAKKRWSSKEERQEQSNRLKKKAPWKGKKLSDEHRRSISLGKLGQRVPKFSEIVVPSQRGRKQAVRRKGIPHPCRSIIEANFARVLLKENVPYEYRPIIFGLSWAPSFRLLQPLYELVPDGWVEVIGWQQKTGFLPPALAQKITMFKKETGEDVFTISPNSVLWKGIESIYSSDIFDWETPRTKSRSGKTN